MTKWTPPPPMPKLRTVGYEIEIRPCEGVWAHFEGRVVRLMSFEDSEAVHRDHYLPDYGPTSNGRTWVSKQPYWARAHTRTKLAKKLRDALNLHLEKQRNQPETIRLEETMSGWT